MKMHITLFVSALLMLSSCASVAVYTQSSSSKYDDGIYYTPNPKSAAAVAASNKEFENLVAKTKQSPIYIKGATVDTLFIPEKYSATLKFDTDNNISVTLFDVDPYNNWFYAGVFHRPYWHNSWAWNYPWFHTSFYFDSWYWHSWYWDNWYWDSWFYGPYHYSWWPGYYYDPWYYPYPGWGGYVPGPAPHFGYRVGYDRYGHPQGRMNGIERRRSIAGGSHSTASPAPAPISRTVASSVQAKGRLSSERAISDRNTVQGVVRNTSSRPSSSAQAPSRPSSSTRQTASAPSRNTINGTYSNNRDASRSSMPSRSNSINRTNSPSRPSSPSAGSGNSGGVSRGGFGGGGATVSRGSSAPSGGGAGVVRR